MHLRVEGEAARCRGQRGLSRTPKSSDLLVDDLMFELLRASCGTLEVRGRRGFGDAPVRQAARPASRLRPGSDSLRAPSCCRAGRGRSRAFSSCFCRRAISCFRWAWTMRPERRRGEPPARSLPRGRSYRQGDDEEGAAEHGARLREGAREPGGRMFIVAHLVRDIRQNCRLRSWKRKVLASRRACSLRADGSFVVPALRTPTSYR